MPSPLEDADAIATSVVPASAVRMAQAQPAQSSQPAPSPQPAKPAAAAAATTPAADAEPIGNVATLTGAATVTRNNQPTPLKIKDDIYLNDAVQTSVNSTLGVTFNDATTFKLTANSQLTIDNYIYEEGGSKNAAVFDIVKGTVAFAAAAVAKTGDMKISTPTATLGIRGTTGLVEVPEGTTATSRNNVAIKLYPDADGKVGRIEVNDRSGARLGFLTQGASGFAIRPGAGGRFAAQPITISPQQMLRDQGVVRQVHAAQSVGRQVVTQQRALRRANPALNNPNRTNQPPGAQRPNGQPGQNRPGQPQQPGAAPNRQGLQQRPGAQPLAPAQPGAPAQQGAPARPAVQQPATVQPPAGARQPGLQQGAPGLQNRPGPQPKRPAAPKIKQPKKKR